MKSVKTENNRKLTIEIYRLQSNGELTAKLLLSSCQLTLLGPLKCTPSQVGVGGLKGFVKIPND